MSVTSDKEEGTSADAGRVLGVAGVSLARLSEEWPRVAKGGRSVVTMMRSWDMAMRAVLVATAPHKKSTGSARRHRGGLPHGELPAMATALAPIPSTEAVYRGLNTEPQSVPAFPLSASTMGPPLLRRCSLRRPPHPTAVMGNAF